MAASRWYEDTTKLHGLLGALTEAGVLEDASEVRDFLRAPYKYDAIYGAWQECGYPSDDTDDSWQDFLNALGSDDSGEDEEDETE